VSSDPSLGVVAMWISRTADCFAADSHWFVVVVLTSSVAAGFDRHGMPPPASNHDLLPFDLETSMRVASKVGKLHSKFGHTGPLGSRTGARARGAWEG